MPAARSELAALPAPDPRDAFNGGRWTNATESGIGELDDAVDWADGHIAGIVVGGIGLLLAVMVLMGVLLLLTWIKPLRLVMDWIPPFRRFTRARTHVAAFTPEDKGWSSGSVFAHYFPRPAIGKKRRWRKVQSVSLDVFEAAADAGDPAAGAIGVLQAVPQAAALTAAATWLRDIAPRREVKVHGQLLFAERTGSACASSSLGGEGARRAVGPSGPPKLPGPGFDKDDEDAARHALADRGRGLGAPASESMNKSEQRWQASAAYQLGVHWQQVGDYVRADAAYAEVLKHKPGQTAALYNRAVIQIRLERYPAARSTLTELAVQFGLPAENESWSPAEVAKHWNDAAFPIAYSRALAIHYDESGDVTNAANWSQALAERLLVPQVPRRPWILRWWQPRRSQSDRETMLLPALMLHAGLLIAEELKATGGGGGPEFNAAVAGVLDPEPAVDKDELAAKLKTRVGVAAAIEAYVRETAGDDARAHYNLACYTARLADHLPDRVGAPKERTRLREPGLARSGAGLSRSVAGSVGSRGSVARQDEERTGVGAAARALRGSPAGRTGRGTIADREADLGLRQFDRDLGVEILDQALYFADGLARHDDARHAFRAFRCVKLDLRETMAVGRDRAQLAGLAVPATCR